MIIKNTVPEWVVHRAAAAQDLYEALENLSRVSSPQTLRAAEAALRKARGEHD